MVESLASSVNRPRAYISIDGQQVIPIEASVEVSLHQSADTFYAKFPLDNAAGLDEVYFADTAPLPVTILATNDYTVGGLTTMIVGQADKPLIDFAQRTVSIRGRDLTGSLTDLKTNERFLNQSNQQVITQLAGRVGLTVNFQGTTDQAGLQFDQDFNEISDLDSCWNVIVAAAKRLGCIAFIKGTVLFIQPLDQDPSTFFTVRYQRPTPSQIQSGNFVGLTCSRNLNLSKDASITVQSWQHKAGKTVTSKFNSKGKTTGSGKLLYEFRGANLNKEQQDRIAKSHLKETLSHEREVQLSSLPGNVDVNPATMGLKLQGTGTAFDQDYIMSTVSHHWSTKGYLMDIGAHSQDDDRGEPEQAADDNNESDPAQELEDGIAQQ